MMKIEFQTIDLIHTPFITLASMPIQLAGGAGVEGTVEMFKEYKAGLKDLKGFSHIILLYNFYKSRGFKSHGGWTPPV